MDSELENLTVLTVQELKAITNNFSAELMIGQGAFATFYKGVHKDGVVAVKVFHQYANSRFENEFDNEVMNMMRLEHHPNILRPVAYCHETIHVPVEYEGRMVMAEKIYQALCFPYFHNGSLRRHISDESHGLDWPTRYRIIKGACEGLKHLHNGLAPAHVLHLDIKPDNILLDDDMEPKLSDFGLSKFFYDEQDNMRTPDAIGTMGYLPPEYIEHQVVSKKFDIFSLGVVMIKIIAGDESFHFFPYMTDRPDKFIDVIHANWRKEFQSEFTGSTLDAYCEQVKRCIETALLCVERDRQNRPDIVDITLTLKETETHKGFEQVWKMSYEDLKNITDKFNPENIISEGLNSVVYKGKLENGEPVAVKKLKNNPTDPNAMSHAKQIMSEGHLMNIEHENIVRLVGYFHGPRQVPVEINPGKFKLMAVTESLLCYEWLSNRSLEDKMRNNQLCRLDWQTRYSLIQGICEGLHYLHNRSKPIVHRDLKPGNVLLDDNMVPKLGDFGISRTVPAETQAHSTRAFGSSGYMAPETTRDTAASEITTKSDIYSLGVLILEIVTGEKCPDHDQSGRFYIEKVREAQKQNSYVASRYPSLEDRFLQQVKNWINIGLRCAEELPHIRPPIEHIMHFLETESVNSVNTHEEKVSKISFKELEDITNKFSPRYGESIFGAVYKGTRVNGDDVIVIKLKEQMMRISPAQFEGEVNRMRFKHNNILQLEGYCDEIHAGEVRERLICYKFFRGSLLGEIIYGDESLNQLHWEARYEIIKGICLALKYLHEECELAHMGITPTNIWLDDEKIPKLGACGLSRLIAKDQTQIYSKESVESWGYVAPEHVKLTTMTTESDIYSLGVLILEIVTGQMCSSSNNGSAASFIANVHKAFDVATKYQSLDAECLQQVKGCITVGVRCAEANPDKRPTAGEIIPMLEKECTSKTGFWNALCSGACAKA